MPQISLTDEDASTKCLDTLEPLAIIGLAAKFPQDAATTEKLWEFLLKARSAMTPFPIERSNAKAFYHPDPEHGGTFHVKGGHFLTEDPGYFDAAFFNVTKTELLTLDPQQRLVLESVYHALENACIPMTKAVSSRTSVFASGFNHDHLALLNSDPESAIKYKPTNVSNSIIANRVSWFFDFKAPSLTVDTACSSSMVALHLATQSLRSGESEMAVVSGVNILENPIETVSMSHHGYLAPEGRCFSFDHRAQGYARGEGVGSIILKPLSTAINDGDTIRAVVRGTGVNQDGRTPGITLPSATAQESLIRAVYQSAGLEFNDTMFVEAHGTGTSAGDPIEAEAIGRAFDSRRKDIPLYVGAIKTGIGHLEGGSGVASLIKSVLMLENAIIPPNVNFEKVNPRIPIKRWNVEFPLENTPWPTTGLRRISVNSFGVGGTNAHCILDDAYHYLKARALSASHNTTTVVPTKKDIDRLVQSLKQQERDGTVKGNSNKKKDNSPDALYPGGKGGIGSRTQNVWNMSNGEEHTISGSVPTMFLLSAFDEDGIQRNASAIAEYLDSRQTTVSGSLLQDLAFTLSNKRSSFPWKSYTLASSVEELSSKLSTGRISQPMHARDTPKIGFVFTGQGAQHWAMGRELMVYPVFRKSLEDATEFIKSLGSPWSLMDELLASEECSRINLPEVAHPSVVALQIALVDLMVSWGITPSRVAGHSSGEISAAYCARKLSKEAAWKVAYYRGYVSSKQISANGAMIAIGLDSLRLLPYLEKVRVNYSGELTIACYNSPQNHTVSGDEAMIDALKELLDAGGVFSRKLNVKNAYHSAHMEQIASEYLQLMGELPLGIEAALTREVHIYSTVSGRRIEQESLNANYWVKNLLSPVQFQDALTGMCFDPITKGQGSSVENIYIDYIVEIGPHSALQSIVKNIITARESHSSITYLSVLNRNKSSVAFILDTIGTLSSKGVLIDTQAINESSWPSSIIPRMLVDLPPYSFNHFSKVVYESRLSKNLRFRKYPRHDLFGAPVPDWNAETPRWRHFIRLHENPWLKDHLITNNYVYPGVGYLVMAIEASRQMADPGSDITGFRLKHVSLKRALMIPNNKEGVETCIAMQRVDESALWSSQAWKRFQITSYNPVGDDWLEHCTGYITLDYKATPGPVDNGREAEAENFAWQEALRQAFATCQTPFDMAKAYDNLQTVGLVFGPLFKNLSDVKVSAQKLGSVTGVVTVPDIAKCMPKNYLHSHLIHPATMDSMIHLFLAAILDVTGRTTLERAAVPTFIKNVWVSSKIDCQPGHTLRGHGTASLIAYDRFECGINIWDGDVDEGRILMDGIRITPLDSANSAPSCQSRELCHRLEWQPDVNLLDSKYAASLVTLNESDYETDLYWVQQLQLATMLLVADALFELESEDFNSDLLEGHFRRYYDWMRHNEEKLKANAITQLTYDEFLKVSLDKKAKEAVYREVEAHNADGALAIRMGLNIAKFLKKEIDPLHLMFGQDNVLDRVYNQVVHLGDLPAHLSKYLSLLGHDRTDIKIIEVGAGTGSSTEAILEALSADVGENVDTVPQSLIANYTFTDISAGFFDKAKERFKSWNHILTFKTLNAEKDIASQGFDLGTYDLLVAGNVVHATANLYHTLSNLRTLLKPGGKILMYEGSRQDLLWSPLAFGQLRGWWLGTEPIRKWCPFVSAGDWDIFLRQAGFSGVDIEFPSSQNIDLCSQSILISTAIDENNRGNQSRKVILVTSDLLKDHSLLAGLKEGLAETLGVTDVSIISILELTSKDTTNAVCISLLELKHPVLSEATETEYLRIRQLLATCVGLLWVTGDPNLRPEFNVVTGLLRTLRWERDLEGPNLLTISIADTGLPDYSLVKVIMKIYKHQFVEAFADFQNSEYLYQDGVIHTNRLLESGTGNNFLASKFSKPTPRLVPFGETRRPIKLSTAEPGLLSKLEWVTDMTYYEPLADTQVEVDIRAVGLNFRDLMIAMGEHMAYSLGSEAAGIVTRIGSGVNKVKPGDRVVYLCGLGSTGCFHTFGRLDQDAVVKIPDDLSYEIAAGLPCVYATVIYGLGDAAHLSKEETILIHAAGGGVGQAAIHYAKMVGAEIYATVSTSEKRNLLVTKYGIPEDHIFSSRDQTFASGIMRCTKGKGVDVILNSLSGEALRNSWECIAPFGRFVEIGKKDAQAHGKVDLTPFLRNVTMTSVELPTMMRYRPNLITRLVEDTIRLYREGKIGEAKPTNIMNFSQVEDGLRLLQSGKGMGKMVFVPSKDDLIPVVPDPLAPYNFQQDASYILAGGLGGLGRSLARWMASRGARSLIFLSKSGHITDSVQEMVNDLRNNRCSVRIFTCDISDKSRLRGVIAECSASLPPIKGCIQGAMTLKDGMFENMSYNDWRAAVKPKVQGSFNLHESLPDLDFFVMLSSATGILGNRSQANYAAGNTYQDALARYRVSRGLPGNSVDLGSILSVGFVAENKGYARHTTAVLEVLREDEIHAILEFLIDPRYSSSQSEPDSQLVVGLATAATYHERGVAPPRYLSYPLFTHLRKASASKSGDSEENPTYLVHTQMSASTTLEEAANVVLNGIRSKLSSLLDTPADNIDLTKSISSNGVDSLVAMEFRTWLVKDLGADIPLLELTGTSSITTLSHKIASLSKLARFSSPV